jgi:hypothetical protein
VRLVTFARLPIALVVLAGLTLTLAPQTVRPTPAAANVITANTLTICGTVSGYLAPSIYSNGYIIINGTTYSIEPQATLSNPSLIASGAAICLQATFDSSGAIIAAIVTTTAVAPLSLCGNVGPFLAPTSVAPGYIVVNNTTFPVAPGIFLPGWNLLAPNAGVCLQATLNPFGQISYGSILAASTGVGTQPFRVCGAVSGFIPATPFSTGSITINGHQFAIAPGAFLSVAAGADVCLDGTLNAFLQIVSASVTVNVPNTPVLACGAVTLFVAAGAGSTGVIIINGQTYTIAPNVLVAGGNLAVPGANVCLSGALGPVNQIVSASLTLNGTVPGPVSQPGPQTLDVCAVVTDYVASTVSATGLVSLGGKTFNIAPGGGLTGAALLTSGTNVCIQAAMNGAGQISSGTVTLNGNLQVTVCGLVQTYTAATASTVGSLVIAGITFPIAAGTTFTGSISTPATLSVAFTLSGQGQIVGGTVTTGGCTGNTISGPIGAYVPPTGTTVGSITIGGATYPVAVGIVLTITNATPLSAHLVQTHTAHYRAL